MYFKKTILQKVMFAKSYHSINVCIFSSYIRASFMQINVVLVQLASCCCLSTIHNNYCNSYNNNNNNNNNNFDDNYNSISAVYIARSIQQWVFVRGIILCKRVSGTFKEFLQFSLKNNPDKQLLEL